jgi:fucose permease
LLLLGFASFFVFGVALVLVGANQADLARDLGLDLARSGLLVSALALGIGVGVVGAGPAVDRRARRPLFVGASLLAALALLLVERHMGFERAFVHVAALGVGIGVYETLLNAVISERYQARAARPLVFVHAAATLGAVVAPPLVGWLSTEGDWTASFRAAGAGHLALAAAAMAVRFPTPAGAHRPQPPLRQVLAPGLLPFAAIGFAYVGVEAAVTVFSVPYAVGALGLGEERGLAGISAFWLGLLGGRLALLAWRRDIDARFLSGAGLMGAVALAAAVGSGARQVELALAATGLSLGLVFPVMIALAAQRFPEARGTATGLVAGAGAMGGFALPWLHGALGDAYGAALSLGGLSLWCLVIAAAAGVAARVRAA